MRIVRIVSTLLLFVVLWGCAPRTNTVLWQENIISEALLTLENLIIEQERGKKIRDYLENAKALYIETNNTTVGLGLGFEGGRGLFLVRSSDGRWSSPAFMTSGGVSIGLQLGVLSDRSITFYLTNKALLSVVDGSGISGGLGLGGAVGGVGESATTSVSTSTENDVVVFGSSSGVFIGAVAKAESLRFEQELNDKFYNAEETTLRGIVIEGRANNPAALPLIKRLNSLTQD